MQWTARTPDDTQAIGAALARAVQAEWSAPEGRSGPLIAWLTGDLGAGKTTLARGFLRESGVTGPVRSPTYTLVEIYDTRGFVTLHLDLYRLQEPSELEPLGLREHAVPGHVWLVEWPERAGDRLPPADLIISLHAAPDAHDISAKAITDSGHRWMAGLTEVELPGPRS